MNLQVGTLEIAALYIDVTIIDILYECVGAMREKIEGRMTLATTALKK